VVIKAFEVLLSLYQDMEALSPKLDSIFSYIDNHQVFPAYIKIYFQHVHAISGDKILDFDSNYALYFQFTNHY